ncbi:MAG: transglycosylase SLT domain-containing protein [Acidobacteriota bacterium]
MRPLVAIEALLVICLVQPAAVRAEVYTYLDAKGVYTITNIPPGEDVALIKTVDDDGKETVYGPLQIVPVTPPELYEDDIVSIARAHGIDPELVKAVIWVESAYNPRAVSNKGARGLMQLIPATAQRFGVSNIFDPTENITGGVKYLRFLLDIFNENTKLSLAAYNAGEEAVQRHNGIPPYRETRRYVELIAKIYGRDLQSAVNRQIYRVTDADGHSTYTNLPPDKPEPGQKVEKVVR